MRKMGKELGLTRIKVRVGQSRVVKTWELGFVRVVIRARIMV